MIHFIQTNNFIIIFFCKFIRLIIQIIRFIRDLSRIINSYISIMLSPTVIYKNIPNRIIGQQYRVQCNWNLPTCFRFYIISIIPFS